MRGSTTPPPGEAYLVDQDGQRRLSTLCARCGMEVPLSKERKTRTQFCRDCAQTDYRLAALWRQEP